MRCANCGTELIPGKQFCHACGARAERVCPNCGATIEPSFHFCPDCGARIATEAPVAAVTPAAPTARAATDRWDRLSRHIPEELAHKIRASMSAVTGERKLVTVLFCDLVGSTAIAEGLDPEEYHDLLEDYLELAFREIYRFDGIVNQLAGDGMMALFGAPIAHEDAPQRAVRAALAIRVALDRFNEQSRTHRGPELRVRIGINSGPVVVGTVGNDLKMDYTAIGDTTNLAARLQSLAQPGTILVSEATYRRVRGFFQMGSAGTFQIKGKSEPVVAYEALGLSETATPMAIAAARGLTPFVGRSAELAQLTACYERLAGGLGQVVAVVGEVGSGKSRVLYEFRQHLAGDDIVFFEARCSSLTQFVPYAPFVSMLKRHFGVTPEESSSCTCDKIAQALQARDPRLDRAYPYLCRLLSLPTDGLADLPGDELKRDTFEAVAQFVTVVSERTPVIMIIEDLHWIDEASREMLELAANRVRTGRVMLVVSHRPDFQPSWRVQAAFTQLTLRPLSQRDATEIIRAIAGGPLPPELEELIHVKAEGNPFFTEEITRSLVEEGYVARDNGHVRLTRPAEDIRIPGTVEEVIGARVDRLGPHAKRVLQVAAVLGRQFRREQLAHLLDGEEIDVAGQLAELEQRGVIHRKTVLSDDEFRFGESLTQEVAYAGLLLRERRHLHERVALALDAGAGGATAEGSALRAHHFARSDNREKALEALLHAAQDAEHLPSYPAAARWYRQAWELAEAAIEEPTGASERLRRWAVAAALGLCRMTVLYTSPDDALSERAARRGRELAETLGDAEAVAGLCTYQGMITMSGTREQFADGLALVEKGLAVAQGAGLTLPVINISRGLAYGYLFDGRFEVAEHTLAWVVSELERLGHLERLSDLYLGSRFMRDLAISFGDDPNGCQQAAADTYALALRAPNRTVQSLSAATLASVHFARADNAEAKRWADRSLEIAEAIGNVGALRTAAALALLTRLALGEPVTAARYVELMEQGLAGGGDMALRSLLVTEALLSLGEVTRARRFAEVAYQHAGGRFREALSTTALGEAMRRLGPQSWSDAERWYARALALAEEIGARATLALASLGAGELAAARGDAAAGARHGERALTLCRDLGLRRHEARAQRLCGGVPAPSAVA